MLQYELINKRTCCIFCQLVHKVLAESTFTTCHWSELQKIPSLSTFVRSPFFFLLCFLSSWRCIVSFLQRWVSVGSGYGDGARGCCAGKYASVTASFFFFFFFFVCASAAIWSFVVLLSLVLLCTDLLVVLACSASHQILVGKNYQSCLGLPLPPARLMSSVLFKVIAGIIGAVVGGRLLDLKLVAIRRLRDVW